MNDQIRKLAVFGVLMLVALVVATTYWQAWAVAGLADRQDNAIQRVAQFTVKRGLIYSIDGRPLAVNRARRVDGRTYFFRRYPSGDLAANIVGYSTQGRSRAGLERSLNDYLTASNTNLSTVLDRTLDTLQGKTVVGNNIVLTLRGRVQRTALEALGSRCGGVAAVDVKTGRIVVLASSPTYDPNLVERNFHKIEQIRADCSPAAPLVNRAAAGLYAPGSTFKILTAAAALDSGLVKPDSMFDDPGYCIEYGKRVNNYDTTRPFGRVNFTQAMQYSINSVFCEIGKRLGGRRILEYAKRFGFYELPSLELPDSEVRTSGLYVKGKPFFPKQDFQVDPGRLAFGQERLQVTPLQLAVVAAGIANGGVVMKPFLVDRIVAPGGDVIRRTQPKELDQAIKPETAAVLTEMMVRVVQDGTGTAAQIPGVGVAGKTGTAETGVAGRNTTAFVCFAPADDPKYAVAVVLENQSGTGGKTAAPIAKVVLESLLRGGT